MDAYGDVGGTGGSCGVVGTDLFCELTELLYSGTQTTMMGSSRKVMGCIGWCDAGGHTCMEHK